MEYQEIKTAVKRSWHNLDTRFPEKEIFIEYHNVNVIDKMAQYFKMLDDNGCSPDLDVAEQINNPYMWGVSIDALLNDPRFNDMVAMPITVPTLDPEQAHDATTAFEGHYFDQLMTVMQILDMKWSDYVAKDYDFIKYRVAENVCQKWSAPYDLHLLVGANSDWIETIVDFDKLRGDLFERAHKMIEAKIGQYPTKISDDLTINLRQDVIDYLDECTFGDPQTFDFFTDLIGIAKGNSSDIDLAYKKVKEKFEQRYL